MSEVKPQQRRRPRRRRGPSRRPDGAKHRERCARAGCERYISSRNTHCSFICRVIEGELATAQRVCVAVGPNDTTVEMWATLVELADAWTKYQELDTMLFEAALSTGITHDQWRAIKHGEVSAA